MVQPPTGVRLVVIGESSVQVLWNAVSGVLLYQVKVIDSDPSKSPVTKTTTNTQIVINDLEPCSDYTMAVSSVNYFLVPGEPENVTHSTSSK